MFCIDRCVIESVNMLKKIALVVIVLLAGMFLLANAFILSFHGSIVPAAAVPERNVALVFGGGMKSPGVMTDMQTDRVVEAVALYKAGKVKKLMMTGDDGVYVNDEVTFMRQYAIQQGVLAADVSVDPHGYRTYESCYRARHVYGLTSTIAISQEFQLSRIIYLCQGFGINTLGVAADLRDYGFASYKMNVREALARLKAFWQFSITRPMPISLEK